MKKVLFIANSDRHIKLCHIPYLKMFKDNGYEVHVATNTSDEIEYCDKKICINLKRNPYSILNLFAVFGLRRIVKKENYDIISCHTPIGGFLGRMSTILLKNKPIVFYTAHGFHFYKGNNIVKNFIYYNVEKMLSKRTTAIITMNEEDYINAKNYFKCDIYKINGIGMNLNRLELKDNTIKDKYDLQGKFIVTYIAEFSKRKNQIALIKELNKHNLDKDNICFLFIGDSRIKRISKYFKNPNIRHIDFVDNVGDYINISDIIISSSKQEGLPQNILEAMYFNKMIIATNIRGHKDLITNKNGVLVNNIKDIYTEVIKYKNKKNKHKIINDIKKYEIDEVIKDVKNIYNKYISERLK